MKYIWQPNVTVIDHLKAEKIFIFDDKGEFVTEDEKIIKFMAKNKSFIKCEENEIVKEVEVIEENEIKTIEEVEIIEKSKEEIKIFKCKKCDFETDNKGLLLSHYKTEHKKEHKKE